MTQHELEHIVDEVDSVAAKGATSTCVKYTRDLKAFAAWCLPRGLAGGAGDDRHLSKRPSREFSLRVESQE